MNNETPATNAFYQKTLRECYPDDGQDKMRDFACELERMGKALRDALAFECHKLGDVPREIDEWDAFIAKWKDQ